MSPVVRNGRGERDESTVGLLGSPLAPVERRQATDEERAGFAPRIASPGLIRLPRRAPPPTAPADDLTPLQRAAVTELQDIDRTRRGEPPIRLAEPSPEEEPVMEPATDPQPISEATIEPLTVLAAAAAVADAAWQNRQAADAAWSRANDVWQDAQRELEHAWRGARHMVAEPLTVVREAAGPPSGPAADGYDPATERQPDDVDSEGATAKGSPNIPEIIPGELADDAAEVVTRRAPTAETPAYAAAKAAFTSDRAREAGGGPGVVRSSTKQDRILALVLTHRGNLKDVAAAIGTTSGNVTATLHNAGKRGRLTVAMLDVLPAAFAKYSAVGSR